MEKIKTISDIIVNWTQPDIDDSKLLCYTDWEVRQMILEASKQAYKKGSFDAMMDGMTLFNETQFINIINQ